MADRLALRRQRRLEVHLATASRMHPIAAFAAEQLIDHPQTTDEFMKRVGINRGVLTNWRTGKSPTMATIEPLLSALGYKLAVVPLDHPSFVRKGD